MVDPFLLIYHLLSSKGEKMKIGQINHPSNGVQMVEIKNDLVFLVENKNHKLITVLDFIRCSTESGAKLEEIVEENCCSDPLPFGLNDLNNSAYKNKYCLELPIHSPEVWACGVTYKKSAEFRDDDTQTSKGIYDYVYSSNRPELFYKGNEKHCTGPNNYIGIRKDSSFTAVEPELAVVLDSKKQIVGFMASNDVSAWDIERENPLYLPQSKIFLGCCSIGPLILLASSEINPYSFSIQCDIKRNGLKIFSGTTDLNQMKRSINELIEWLFYANPVSDGAVLLTGTGIIQTEDAALREGDIVEITIPEIGTLKNFAKVVH